MATLEIKNLYASTDGKTLLRGLTLTIATGEIHALMGHNGAGKSTLVQVLMGNPKYQVTKGDILFDKKSILKLSPDERAKLGIFLGFQYPVEVPGVSISNFLRAAYSRLKLGEKSTLGVLEFKQKLAPLLASFGVSDDYAVRYLNSGFSGGEKSWAKFSSLPCSGRKSRSLTSRIQGWMWTRSGKSQGSSAGLRQSWASCSSHIMRASSAMSSLPTCT